MLLCQFENLHRIWSWNKKCTDQNIGYNEKSVDFIYINTLLLSRWSLAFYFCVFHLFLTIMLLGKYNLLTKFGFRNFSPRNQWKLRSFSTFTKCLAYFNVTKFYCILFPFCSFCFCQFHHCIVGYSNFIENLKSIFHNVKSQQFLLNLKLIGPV